MQDRIYEWAEERWYEKRAPQSKELDWHTDEVNQIAQPELDILEEVSGYIPAEDVDDFFYDYAVELIRENTNLPENWEIYIDYEAFADDLQVSYDWIKICGQDFLIIP